MSITVDLGIFTILLVFVKGHFALSPQGLYWPFTYLPMDLTTIIDSPPSMWIMVKVTFLYFGNDNEFFIQSTPKKGKMPILLHLFRMVYLD